nr:hypothetical protein GCM10020185_14350 [Pseudomonas brassicacearum subsp. brassicacearum]
MQQVTLEQAGIAVGVFNRYPALIGQADHHFGPVQRLLGQVLEKNATGLRPPETTRVAAPRASIALRNCSATFSARPSASTTGFLNSWALTPCGSFNSDIAIP